MHEFGGYDFINGNALKKEGNIQSTTKIDSVLITFSLMIKAKIFEFNFSLSILK
jgi:hypothetical protein